MASERSRATCGDGPQHVELLVAKPGAVLFPEAVTADPKDVSHFHGRPNHLSFFPVIAVACLANAGELQTLQRVGYCLQVPLRQMKILGGGLQVAMAEQNLNRTQVRSRLEQMDGPAVA